MMFAQVCRQQQSHSGSWGSRWFPFFTGVSWYYLLSGLVGCSFHSDTSSMILKNHFSTCFPHPNRPLSPGQCQLSFPFSPSLPENDRLILLPFNSHGSFQLQPFANSKAWREIRSDTNRAIIPGPGFLFLFMMWSLLSSSNQSANHGPKMNASFLPLHFNILSSLQSAVD